MDAADPPAEVLRLVTERLEAARGYWSSCGRHGDVVRVHLPGKGEALARELHDRFGDAVALTVGAFAYPFPDPPEPVAPLAVPRSTIDTPSIALRAEPDAATVVSGEIVTGHVVITSLGAGGRLTLESDQPLAGQLVRDGHVVGGWNGFSVGTGWGVVLNPGESTRVAFRAGTDSRDPRDGPTLPAGTYDLVVTVPLHDLVHRSSRPGQVVTPGVAITVIERDDAPGAGLSRP